MHLFNMFRRKKKMGRSLEELMDAPYESKYFDKCKYIWQNYIPESGFASCLQGELL